ncbi:BTB domain-containing protein [Trichonephila inaurata madagascariensis]|uniref:BTB domain-containing protein n=1 Tax=Trichonephila inaurata madagascariensis TaxID=2747483 RepID=A0A8X6YNP7_9ARAC|nr:BTB domain-containing protein [Trichonephila inaurata madagascariensis]
MANAAEQTVLDIQIEDFSNTNNVFCGSTIQGKYEFAVAVHPRGMGKKTKDYVLVQINEILNSLSLVGKSNDILKGTVSIVDIDGVARFHRSFERAPTCPTERAHFKQKNDYVGEKTFSRSFILERADEFLVDDVLTLRFEISYITGEADERPELERSKSVGSRPSSDSYLLNWPENMKCYCDKREKSNAFTDHAILHTPNGVVHFKIVLGGVPDDLFVEEHESPDFFIPCVKNIDGDIESKICFKMGGKNSELTKYDWVIETNPGKFVLSSKEDEHTFASKLMAASPVFDRMMKTSMKEKLHSCTKLRHVKSSTFVNLLYYFENGKLLFDFYYAARDLYLFAQMYNMQDLARVCSDYMEKYFSLSNITEMEDTANLHSDEYLKNLVKLYKDVSKKFPSETENKRDRRPDFACFM